MLSDHGYTVLTASNGAEALQIADAPSVPEIDLLLTDLIMPIMGGKEVADRLTANRPSLKVLFTQGTPTMQSPAREYSNPGRRSPKNRSCQWI